MPQPYNSPAPTAITWSLPACGEKATVSFEPSFDKPVLSVDRVFGENYFSATPHSFEAVLLDLPELSDKFPVSGGVQSCLFRLDETGLALSTNILGKVGNTNFSSFLSHTADDGTAFSLVTCSAAGICTIDVRQPPDSNDVTFEIEALLNGIPQLKVEACPAQEMYGIAAVDANYKVFATCCDEKWEAGFSIHTSVAGGSLNGGVVTNGPRPEDITAFLVYRNEMNQLICEAQPGTNPKLDYLFELPSTYRGPVKAHANFQCEIVNGKPQVMGKGHFETPCGRVEFGPKEYSINWTDEVGGFLLNVSGSSQKDERFKIEISKHH